MGLENNRLLIQGIAIMKLLFSFTLSFILCALLGAGLSLIYVQTVMMPKLESQVLKDTKAYLLTNPELLKEIASEQEVQQQTQNSDLVANEREIIKRRHGRF